MAKTPPEPWHGPEPPATELDPLAESARQRRRIEYAAFLPVLGAFLLLPPILALFSGSQTLYGVPVIVIYIFSAWAMLIVCAARLSRLLRRDGQQATDSHRP